VIHETERGHRSDCARETHQKKARQNSGGSQTRRDWILSSLGMKPPGVVDEEGRPMADMKAELSGISPIISSKSQTYKVHLIAVTTT